MIDYYVIPVGNFRWNLSSLWEDGTYLSYFILIWIRLAPTSSYFSVCPFCIELVVYIFSDVLEKTQYSIVLLIVKVEIFSLGNNKKFEFETLFSLFYLGKYNLNQIGSKGGFFISAPFALTYFSWISQIVYRNCII